MDSSQIVTMHIQSVDQNKAIKTIKHTITELDSSPRSRSRKKPSAPDTIWTCFRPIWRLTAGMPRHF